MSKFLVLVKMSVDCGIHIFMLWNECIFQMIFFAPWTRINGRLEWYRDAHVEAIRRSHPHHSTVAHCYFFTHYNSFVVWLWKMSELWIVGVWHAWVTLHPFSLQQTIGEPITFVCVCVYVCGVCVCCWSPHIHHIYEWIWSVWLCIL